MVGFQLFAHTSSLFVRPLPGYGQRFVRALDGSFAEEATRCGVNIVSGDYWQSDQMEQFVWSFARNVNISAPGCATTYSHGRWILDVGLGGVGEEGSLSQLPSLPFRTATTAAAWRARARTTRTGCCRPKLVRLPRESSAGNAWNNDRPLLLRLFPVFPLGPWSTVQNACPPGYTAGVPTNGYANARLHSVALTEQVWLNYRNN